MSAFFIQLLIQYQLPAIFLGAVFFGETVIMTAAFLSAQGIWSLAPVFGLALLGTVISDLIWFVFGRKLFISSQRWAKQQAQYAGFLRKVETIFGQRPFRILLFIKFLYGTRILTIMYLSTRHVRFWTFVLYDTIGTLLWLPVILALGWFAGKGIADIIPLFNRLQYAVSFLLALGIAYKLVTVWLEKRITKR